MRLNSIRTDRWTPWHALAAIFMAVLGVAATFPAWVDITQIALNDDEYSHIFLVPLVALWPGSPISPLRAELALKTYGLS